MRYIIRISIVQRLEGRLQSPMPVFMEDYR